MTEGEGVLSAPSICQSAHHSKEGCFHRKGVDTWGVENHGVVFRRWDAGGWMRPAAYTLFDLTPPWLLEGGGDFKTSESGQMLFNRCAALTTT